MNKLLYRIIFNKARGMLMVVADISRNGRTGGCHSERSEPILPLLARVAPLRFVLWLAAGWVSLPLNAAIVADGSAPGNQQATILATANGLPQVNIQTPNEHGVSRNQYSQFNVDSRGAILNNSQHNTQTQLAGQITGNPWLAQQEARIIVNEVNSRNLSQLNGFIEVAGRRADVVIANPYGIHCNGCGFINAEKVALVAGQARMEGGKLKGFDVNGGRINITGQGLNTLGTDYTQLIARAVKINARLQAGSELKVSVGHNETDARGNITRVKAQDKSERPVFALDVAVLGGMYANKIVLEGTEQGVGVRHAGELGALAGELSLSSNGKLFNSGQISGQDSLKIAVKDEIHNTGGLTTNGNLKLSAGGKLHNEGLIRGGKDVSLAAAVIDSTRKSTLAAGGDLQLTANGELKAQGQNLASGSLYASGSHIFLEKSQTDARTVALKARQGEVRTANAAIRGRDKVTVKTQSKLDNNGGQISGGILNLHAPELNNTDGLLQQEGTQDLVLSGDLIGNNRGKLLSGGNTYLQAARIENQAGTLASNDHHLSLRADSLNNQHGSILGGTLSVHIADSIDNMSGHLMSQGFLSLEAAKLNNQQGVVTTLGDGQLTLRNKLDNTAGLLQAGETLELDARQIANRNTRRPRKGLEAKTLSLTADKVDNTEGNMRATHHLNITANARLENPQGLLSSGGQLQIQGQKTDINNHRGTLIATGDTTIQISALKGHGDLLSEGKLTVQLQQDLHHTGTIKAKDKLTLSNNGKIINAGTLAGQKNLNLDAREIINNAEGHISARETHITAEKYLNNTGLIDGDLTSLKADTLNNTGTGRIFGGHVAITAKEMNNLKSKSNAAVIAARDRLDIAAGTVNNRDHALITSQGDIIFGAALDSTLQATGQGHILNNHGASVEAGRHITIGMQQVNNTNRHLTTQTRVVENARYHEAVLRGQTTRYPWAQVDTRDSNKYGVHDAIMPDGSRNDDFYEYNYRRRVTETQLKSSEPGKILAAQDIIFNSTSLRNYDSQIIAGGTLGGDIGTLDNHATLGERITTDRGKQVHWYAEKKKKKLGGTETSQGHDHARYRPDPITTTVDLKTHYWQGATPMQSHPVQPGTRQMPGFDQWQESSAQKGTVTLTLPPERVNGQSVTPVIRTVSPNIRLPENSLYTLHPGSDSHPLVETDPRFVDKKRWLTSDYMQQVFTADPGHIHRRLGDGYYEQQLIRDQLIHLTGQRYTGNHAENEAQYRALMNRGITFGKQHNLQPGIALTSSQMALLTSDIVWLTDQNVRLADGSIQRVRVPQVYVKLTQQDLTANGALLGGKQIALSAQENIINSGSIRGQETTQLTAKNITNSGTVSGNRVTLDSRDDIHNRGGQIRGGSALSLLAGQDISSQTTTRTDGIRNWIDRPAGIYVNQADSSLKLSALNNITLSGSTLDNQGEHGSTLLKAGGDLRLSTVGTTQTETGDWDDDNWRHLIQHTEKGSRITTSGPLTLSAGRDITARAADVTADSVLEVQAERNIRLSAGKSITHLSEHNKQSSSGLLSKTSLETHDEVHKHQALETTFSGDTVRMQSGYDLVVSGSNIAGTQDVSLNAGHDLTVRPEAELHQEFHYREEKNAGLMGSGGIGFAVGSASQQMSTDQIDNLNHGSVVGSSKGNTLFKATNRATVHGSDNIAGKNLVISGCEVQITTAENSRTTLTKIEQKQSGLTVALSGSAGSALNAGVSSLQEASKESDSRLSALQNTKAALSGIQAVQAYGLDQAQSEAANNGAAQGATNTVGISASYGSQSSKSETRTESRQAQGSMLLAGENLAIIATGNNTAPHSGDITVTGSRLKAGQDLSLDATKDITLRSAQNSERTTSKNSSKGGSLGVGIGVGSSGYGISVSASINAGKGDEKGKGITYTETLLEADKRLNLTSGRDSTLKGARARGDTLSASVGRNLTIQSEQESDHYTATNQSISAGGSFNFGSMNASGYLSATQDKLRSNYTSVREQSGLFAGKEGYDIRVKDHTQLDGAVIASRADKDRNRLDTATLGWRDIHNRADFSSEHTGVSVSSGAPSGLQLLTNMASNVLSGGNHHDQTQGTTRAAVSEGSVTIRDAARQQLDITQLNRNTAQANDGSIRPIFNKEKEQKRLRQAQLITDIGQQVLDIYQTHESIKATQAATRSMSQSDKRQALQREAQTKLDKAHQKNPLADNGPQAVNELAWQLAYDTALTRQGAAMGGNVRTGVHAVVAALQGLAGGNIQAALAQGAAPYLAAEVKEMTTSGKPHSELSQQEKLNNLVAHALLGGVIAELSYGNALAGATGAVTGELAVPAIALTLYGSADSDTLTSQQKQHLSSLATLASGIAAGLSSDSTVGAVAGAQAAKNAVENNWLAVPVPAPVPGAPVGSGNKVKQDADKNIASGLQGLIDNAVDWLDKITECSFGRVCSSGDDEKQSQPNIGKGLTDIEKAELGGAGSGTPGGWGPQDEENARNQLSSSRTNELSQLFEYDNPRSGIQIGGRTLIEMPNKGNSKVFSGASDTEVKQYFMDLTGSKNMPEARVIPGKGNTYTIRTSQGTFNLRDFSSSASETGDAWTIDIPRGVGKSNASVEIKFLK
ncbi:hemagglutinin repeat-containing protein [Klebsiella sp. BIGb0407]|uniref:two-partner secretion domain-containing protein n=1 Tax=Klebsiella sp. BIGb0407 TaxID=2940603 RepID=UPI0021688708|nr:hemagglutinin repeat-containing protein [Klebsiella sp. BIGb0407]MCS3432233.1 filamentous hemagglutinin [Klebsiella sp. BIGb0407]